MANYAMLVRPTGLQDDFIPGNADGTRVLQIVQTPIQLPALGFRQGDAIGILTKTIPELFNQIQTLCGAKLIYVRSGHIER